MAAPARELKPIVVWGASGQALVLNEFANAVGLSIEALVDNDPAAKSPIPGVPVFHARSGLEGYLAAADQRASLGAAVAIGGAGGPDRLELGAVMSELGLEIVDALHPNGYVAIDAEWQPGLQLMAGAVVGTRARLGAQCLINTGASVDHECTLGGGVHIGPGAHLGGCVQVGDLAFVGLGASVLPRVSIGRGAVVGAGAVVTRDVPDGATVVGNPALPLPPSKEPRAR